MHTACNCRLGCHASSVLEGTSPGGSIEVLLLPRIQVVWGELGSSPLECLSILSSEVAVPLLKSQIKHGSMPDAAATELSDSMQSLVSSCE